VYEERLSEAIFKYENITEDEFKDSLRDKFSLENKDATLIARYFFSPKLMTNSKLKVEQQQQSNIKLMEYKLRKLAGNYTKIESNFINQLTTAISNNKEKSKMLISSLEEIMQVEY